MKTPLLLLGLCALTSCAGGYVRNEEITLDLEGDPTGTIIPYWGPEERDADHGRVAIDDNCHALVTQHTTRRPAGVPYDLLQVELAFYEYQFDGLPDDWFWEERHLVGAITAE